MKTGWQESELVITDYPIQFDDHYFFTLSEALEEYHPNTNSKELEEEWRSMYPMAWADFHRFLMGWMPTHQKLTEYSKKQVELALSNFL